MVRHGWLFEPHSTSSTGGTSAGGPQALRSALTQPAAWSPTRDAEQERASPLLLQRALPTPDAEQEGEEQQTGAQEACAYILSPAPPPLADKARWPTGTPEPLPLDERVEGPGLPLRQGLARRPGLADPRLPSPSDALPAWLRTPAPDLVTGTSHTPTPAKTSTARGVWPGVKGETGVMRHAGAVVNAPETSETGPRQLPQAAAQDALVEQDPGSSVGAVGVGVGVARRAIQPGAQAAWPRWTGGIRNMSEVRSANLVSSI